MSSAFSFHNGKKALAHLGCLLTFLSKTKGSFCIMYTYVPSIKDSSWLFLSGILETKASADNNVIILETKADDTRMILNSVNF